MNKKIFIRAAELVANQESWAACSAIADSSLNVRHSYCGTPPELIFFKEMYKPEHLYIDDLWFGSVFESENQLARSLALLFCAEVCNETK